MRKLLLLLLISIFFLSSSAQDIKKSILLSGSINGQFNDYYHNTITPTYSFSSMVKIGYVFNRNHALGLNLPASYRYHYFGYYTKEDFILETGLFYRFMLPVNKINFSSDIFYNNFYEQTNDLYKLGPNNNATFKGYRYGLGLGFSYFVSNNTAVEIYFQGSIFKRSVTNMNLEIYEKYKSIKTFIGIVYYLNTEKDNDDE